jgi:predicted MFS family arabinose efflux permease
MSESKPAGMQSALSKPAIAGATLALVLLTIINFLNYIDRYLLAGELPLVSAGVTDHGVHPTDAQMGALTFWFFIAYMIAAPLTGWLGDRFPRKPLIVTGVLFWSACNFFTGSVHSYFALNLRHAALGIGEASFGIFAPALLADFYPEKDRNRILSIFYLAIPVGAALGYLAGGMIGEKFGWATPFLWSAIPGLLMALLVLFCMREPVRGASETIKATVDRSTVRGLARNPAYLYATIGMAMTVFSLGGISAWVPTFFHRDGGYAVGHASFLVGAITAVTGILGTGIGGWIAQLWLRRNHRALYLVSAWSALLAVPPALLAFFGPRWAMLPGIALAEFCIFLGTGPLNAAITNSVSAVVRSSAIAVELFLIHALGDAPSPWLIGRVSDISNLRLGMGLTLVTMLIAAVLLFRGAHFAPVPEEN